MGKEEDTKDEGRNEESRPPKRDLEERTEAFAQRVRIFLSGIRVSVINESDARQLIRSSGSAGANYLEAQNALGKKDFVMRIRIARKEAKESAYWLRLLTLLDEDQGAHRERADLTREAIELAKILGAIVRKTE